MLWKRTLIYTALALAFGAALPGYAQQRPADATPRVPALDSFHEVIFKIWHEAWPKKDTAMLRQLLPDVQKGISNVASAQLPGILREKKDAWSEGVEKLQAAGSEYAAAAEAKDDPRLLTAAENLHSRFEGLMRAIRPALKELDEFHGVLYTLYHHYLPGRDAQKIRESAMELKERMAALNSAKLPERLKQKESEFQSARSKLSASVDALAASVQTDSEQKIAIGVNEVHSNYQSLEKIFE
jgi:hypothetical protein